MVVKGLEFSLNFLININPSVSKSKFCMDGTD
jgi:hypothetical protein